MSEFKESLYDQLITKRLRESFDRQAPTGLRSLAATLEENDCPDYLARHLIGQIRSLLRGVCADDRKRQQIALANSLLVFMRFQEEELIEPDPIDPPARSCAPSTAARQHPSRRQPLSVYPAC